MNPFDITLYSDNKTPPELNKDEIKGIIISAFAEYTRNVKEIEYQTETIVRIEGNVVLCRFIISNTNDKRQDNYYFHWIAGESIYKLIDYVNDACNWISEYKFLDLEEPENWQQKYDNKD